MGSGFRTFASGEVLTSSNVQNYLMDQAVMVFAGTAERGSALASPEVGMTAYSTATGLQVYNGTAWVDVSTGYGVASGANSTATITVSGTSYTLLTFTGSGTLTVSKAGLFDVLMVGGGGAGGGHGSLGANPIHKGGGGAGQVSFKTVYLNSNTTITIGGGAALYATNGSSTIVGSLPDAFVAFGGGTGSGVATLSAGEYNSIRVYGGASGGGGNASYSQTIGIGYAGNDGGTGSNSGDFSNGKGGGGGAGAVGGNSSGTAGGNGGAGYDASTFRGEASSTTFYGGGGGGGGASGGTGGSGGGGGRGSNGSANTGGGGGGSSTTTTSGGTGGSGIVLVRFKV